MDRTELKKLVLDRLKEVGFVITENGALCPSLLDKDGLRQIHKPASQLEIATCQDWLRQHFPEYLLFFANGNEIVPERVDPTLIEVTTEQQHNLFRVARLLWSVPFSKGYGRRLRFLIIDDVAAFYTAPYGHWAGMYVDGDKYKFVIGRYVGCEINECEQPVAIIQCPGIGNVVYEDFETNYAYYDKEGRYRRISDNSVIGDGSMSDMIFAFCEEADITSFRDDIVADLVNSYFSDREEE